jgi:hypothetical protein
VTVTDPRHPLSGQAFPLIGITTTRQQGCCCVVWLREGVEQSLPLAATDRSSESIDIFPIPIDLPSVRQLLATYERIESQSVGGTKGGSDERNTRGGAGGGTNCPDNGHTRENARVDLGLTDLAATENGVSEFGPGVSPGTGQPQQQPGGAQ